MIVLAITGSIVALMVISFLSGFGPTQGRKA